MFPNIRKALISGGIPSFIDFIGNFRGNSYDEDNLIKQLLDAQKNIIFYGDDTWLKLFPRHFNRSEGVTSFFVAVCSTLLTIFYC